MSSLLLDLGSADSLHSLDSLGLLLLGLTRPQKRRVLIDGILKVCRCVGDALRGALMFRDRTSDWAEAAACKHKLGYM